MKAFLNRCNVTTMQKRLLQLTQILDFENDQIQRLIQQRNWLALDNYQKIGAAYQFVKDEIQFGYNKSDDLSASAVLQDGYGQCNTKSNLLMALLRALGIPCRFHGFTIEQALQKGAIPSYVFWLAPKYIIHSWVEVRYQDRWLNLEGFILDEQYLNAVQEKFSDVKTNFCGYGVATQNLAEPQTQWRGEDTYIQKEGIHDDFGIYNSPDEFYQEKGTNLSGVKRWLYQNFIRHLINRNVERLRNLRHSETGNAVIQ